jgi:hypothetical protein
MNDFFAHRASKIRALAPTAITDSTARSGTPRADAISELVRQSSSGGVKPREGSEEIRQRRWGFSTLRSYRE